MSFSPLDLRAPIFATAFPDTPIIDVPATPQTVLVVDDDELVRSFLARLLGSIDLVRVWWFVSLSIGLAVLYRKRTGPIAVTVLVVYAVIAVVIAAIQSALSGA